MNLVNAIASLPHVYARSITSSSTCFFSSALALVKAFPTEIPTALFFSETTAIYITRDIIMTDNSTKH